MLQFPRGQIFSALLAITLFSGCQLLERKSKSSEAIQAAAEIVTEKPADLQQHIRNNCASLLYDLLREEKNLSKILIIKRETKGLSELAKNISASARAGAKRLEQLAGTDKTLDLRVMGLPSGEVATRDAISKTKQRELLGGKGEDFEFMLLLTQIEALNYAAHLAKVAGENESRPEHAQEFFAVSREFKNLYMQVVTLAKK